MGGARDCSLPGRAVTQGHRRLGSARLGASGRSAAAAAATMTVGEDDMTKLGVMSEEGLLENIRVRFESDIIYVSLVPSAAATRTAPGQRRGFCLCAPPRTPLRYTPFSFARTHLLLHIRARPLPLFVWRVSCVCFP